MDDSVTLTRSDWQTILPDTLRISGIHAKVEYCPFTRLPEYTVYRFPFSFELKLELLGGCTYRLVMCGHSVLVGSVPSKRRHPELVPTVEDAPAVQDAVRKAISSLEEAAAERMKDLYYHLHGRAYVEDSDDD